MLRPPGSNSARFPVRLVLAGTPVPMHARQEVACLRAPIGATNPSWTVSTDCSSTVAARSDWSVETATISLTCFPELTKVAVSLPVDTILDCDIVVFDAGDMPSFVARQSRLGLARARAAARERRASRIAFDLLELCGDNLRREPLQARRRNDQLSTVATTGIRLALRTDDIQFAHTWLAEDSWFEGEIAKRIDGHYRPGQRDWIKTKRQHTVDLRGAGRCWRHQAGPGARPASAGRRWRASRGGCDAANLDRGRRDARSPLTRGRRPAGHAPLALARTRAGRPGEPSLTARL